jgi:hypothetical protein
VGIRQLFLAEVGSSFHEAVIIEHDAALEPAGIRLRSRHQEHVSDIACFGSPIATRPGDALQSIGAVELRELRLRMQADVRGLLDAANKVLRHALGQSVGAHQHVNVTTRAGEEDRRLACGITATDDYDILVGAEFGLQVSCGIVDAAAKKAVGNIWHPIPGSARDEDGSAAYRFAVSHVDRVWPTLTSKLHGLPGHAQLCSELLCLRECSTGERCA